MKRPNEPDWRVLRAFLAREACAYSKQNTNWSEKLLAIILAKLDSYKGGARYIVIRSYTNVGLLDAELIFPSPKYESCSNIEIDLCTCGNLDCWGTIRFPNGKSVGRKGVKPLN